MEGSTNATPAVGVLTRSEAFVMARSWWGEGAAVRDPSSGPCEVGFVFCGVFACWGRGATWELAFASAMEAGFLRLTSTAGADGWMRAGGA